MHNLPVLLSYLRALSTAYQHFHWKSEGENSYEDHLLHERLYHNIVPELDRVAEKTIGLTDTKQIEPLQDSQLTNDILKKLIPEDTKPAQYIEIATKMEQGLLKLINSLMEEDTTDGLENLLQEIADKHEEHLYLLKQRKTGENMLISLYKMATEMDRKGLYDESAEIEKVIAALVKRTGLKLQDAVALADYFDLQGDFAMADRFDKVIKQAKEKAEKEEKKLKMPKEWLEETKEKIKKKNPFFDKKKINEEVDAMWEKANQKAICKKYEENK